MTTEAETSALADTMNETAASRTLGESDARTGGRTSEGAGGEGADAAFLRGVLQRIATGPTMSKDLTRAEAARAMRLVLEGRADEVQAGIFLIALRMKRETDDELAGILDAIQAGTEPLPLDVDSLVTLVDPYDGYLRGTPLAPFLPAVLAAAGVATLAHGTAEMGPKFGASHARVLAAAGAPVAASAEAARAALDDPEVGWCHALQSAIAPELAALEALRTRIVKRPCLTTVEVAINAFRPRGATHLVTGFVHKGYPAIYAALAKAGGFDGVTVVRGVEGGVVPSLSQTSRVFTGSFAGASADPSASASPDLSSGGEGGLRETPLDPASLGLAHTERAVPLPPELVEEADGRVRSVSAPGNPFARALAGHAAEVGLAALDGERGMARDSLVYAGAVVLFGAGVSDTIEAGAERVRAVLDDGSARARLFARPSR